MNNNNSSDSSDNDGMRGRNQIQTLEDVVGAGLGGLSGRSFAIVAMISLSSPSETLSGKNQGKYSLSLRRVSEESVKSIAESSEALFFLISARVAKMELERLGTLDSEEDSNSADIFGGSGTPYDPMDRDGPGREDMWGDDGSPPEWGGSGRFSGFVASMIESALIEGGAVSQSPFLVSRHRRLRSRVPVEGTTTKEILIQALGRTIEAIQKGMHPVHIEFSDAVVGNEKASGDWFMPEFSRHESAQEESEEGDTRFNVGIDISGMSIQPTPPPDFFDNIRRTTDAELSETI